MYIFCLCYILLSGLLHKETQRTLSTGGISCSFTAAKTLTPVEIPATAGTHSKLDARSKTPINCPIAIRLMKICQLTQCCSMTALVLLRDDVEPNPGWNQPALNQLSGLKIAYLNIRSLSDHLDEFRILRWFETVFIFHSNWTLWKVYTFVVKDYYYLSMADVTVTFQLINSCTLTDTLVVMATWQSLKYTYF